MICANGNETFLASALPFQAKIRSMRKSEIASHSFSE